MVQGTNFIFLLISTKHDTWEVLRLLIWNMNCIFTVTSTQGHMQMVEGKNFRFRQNTIHENYEVAVREYKHYFLLQLLLKFIKK